MAESVDHIEYWDNISSDTYDLLLQQFKSSENIVKLTSIFSACKKDLDIAIINLAKLRLMDNAVGKILDEIGEELGVDRNDADDDTYRIILKIRAFRVSSAGTRPQIIDLISRFTGTEKESINTYIGINKSFDIAFYPNCFEIRETLDEFIKIFPVVSSYRLIEKSGTPLGFISLYNNSNNYGFKGFSSYFDINTELGAGYGHIASLIAATD